MFKAGDIVKIKPEWLDRPSDAHARYIVTNVNDVTQRCYIRCVTTNLPFPGEELVSFEMIERITADRVVYAVIFHRKDGKPREEYEYRKLADAKEPFDLFRKDDSGLYSHIDLTEAIIGLPEVVLLNIQF